MIKGCPIEPKERKGYEIADSMSDFGVKEGKKMSKDKDILEYIEELDRERRGSGQEELGFVGYYNEIVRQSDSNILDTNLSADRQRQILTELVGNLDMSEAWSDSVEEEERRERRGKHVDPSKAQWATVATTPSTRFSFNSPEVFKEKVKQLEALDIKFFEIDGEQEVQLDVEGCRVSFAFWKKMCQYKAIGKKGCRYCGLSAMNKFVPKDITSEQQVASLEDAWEKTSEMGDNRTVFEILPDGSFLNNNEVPIETQDAMMKSLASKECVQKVAIETRPEYCNSLKVRRLLENLRPDQKLEIYFGLETTDDFVSALVHRKGYGFSYFKKNIRRLIDELSEEEKERIELSVYNIIKPAYLTEQESVDLSVKMSEDIREFSEEIGFPIKVKYEPSVVSSGSLQDYLYNRQDEETGERKFEPLSYLSVAELIALLSQKGLEKQAKFGQRDDIDNFTTVSMVSQPDDESMFSQFDFMVYNAVQRFNTKHDVHTFLVDMKIVVEESEEFRLWEKEFYGGVGKSELSQMVRKAFANKELTAEENKKVEMQKAIWRVADSIEYNKDFSDNLKRNGRDVEEDIKKDIIGLFEQENIKVFSVKDFIFVDTAEKNEKVDRLSADNLNMQFYGASDNVAFQIEIIVFNEDDQPQSLWVKVPLKYVGEPDKLDFIYS